LRLSGVYYLYNKSGYQARDTPKKINFMGFPTSHFHVVLSADYE
jgi:hypothetical protein